MRSSYLEQNSGKYFQERPTVISKAISIAASNTTTAAVSIPKGAYVTKVAVLSTVAVTTADIDVGDGDNVDRYFNGIVTIPQYDIMVSGGAADAVASTGDVGGRYYAAADTIDVIENNTGTLVVPAGSIKVLVWYFL